MCSSAIPVTDFASARGQPDLALSSVLSVPCWTGTRRAVPSRHGSSRPLWTARGVHWIAKRCPPRPERRPRRPPDARGASPRGAPRWCTTGILYGGCPDSTCPQPARRGPPPSRHLALADDIVAVIITCSVPRGRPSPPGMTLRRRSRIVESASRGPPRAAPVTGGAGATRGCGGGAFTAWGEPYVNIAARMTAVDKACPRRRPMVVRQPSAAGVDAAAVSPMARLWHDPAPSGLRTGLGDVVDLRRRPPG